MSRVGVHALCTDTKISQFGHSFLVEEYVGSLNIPMYLLIGMEVGQSLDH